MIGALQESVVGPVLFVFTMHVDSKPTGSINQATFEMNDNILENKLELKDLGVIVDSHLTFSNHIAEKVNKAN